MNAAPPHDHQAHRVTGTVRPVDAWAAGATGPLLPAPASPRHAPTVDIDKTPREGPASRGIVNAGPHYCEVCGKPSTAGRGRWRYSVCTRSPECRREATRRNAKAAGHLDLAKRKRAEARDKFPKCRICGRPMPPGRARFRICTLGQCRREYQRLATALHTASLNRTKGRPRVCEICGRTIHTRTSAYSVCSTKPECRREHARREHAARRAKARAARTRRPHYCEVCGGVCHRRPKYSVCSKSRACVCEYKRRAAAAKRPPKKLFKCRICGRTMTERSRYKVCRKTPACRRLNDKLYLPERLKYRALYKKLHRRQEGILPQGLRRSLREGAARNAGYAFCRVCGAALGWRSLTDHNPLCEQHKPKEGARTNDNAEECKPTL